MTGGPGDTAAAAAAGQARAGGWAYAQQRARANARSGAGVGRAGCGWTGELWAARESAGGGLGGPRESWAAGRRAGPRRGGGVGRAADGLREVFPFLLFLSLPFYSSSNLNIVFESNIQIFNELELMPKHNSSTQKCASTCYATIKDPLRVLFYEDYANIKQK
jgi:hypothetical protein